jgi:hypothetical protein
LSEEQFQANLDATRSENYATSFGAAAAMIRSHESLRSSLSEAKRENEELKKKVKFLEELRPSYPETWVLPPNT